MRAVLRKFTAVGAGTQVRAIGNRAHPGAGLAEPDAVPTFPTEFTLAT